uniref:CSON004019 protein n=1 Tax=Culicoides sonorensis TaxID=179676 RepID=A0A336LTA9_CULSO
MNEQDIPIVVSSEKISEFLLTRRIVNKNWPDSIKNIRGNISNAVQDMPEHPDLIKLLSGAHINYFHCLQILEILKKTEADTKNVFGRYSSQRYTNWQEIIKAYERDSVYIAEAAQIFSRNVQFEIPGTKKQIARLEQSKEECEKKCHDLEKSKNTIRNEYQVLCDQFGIKGDDIKKELVKGLERLPAAFDKIAKEVPGLLKAVNLYSSFSNNKDVLPLIRHIASAGNTTVYQYVYGEAPLSIEEPPLNIDTNNDEEVLQVSGDIDFGAVDFGDVNLETGDIDWGNFEEPNIEEVQVVAGGIDFGDSLEESGIVVESTGCSGGVAKGNEAYTLLDSPKYREQFIDEVYELEAFLKLRLYELSADKHQFCSIGSVENFTDHDAKSVLNMLSNVNVTLTSVTDETLYHLHQIKHSPNYVNILTAKLKQRLSAIDKIDRTREELKQKAVNYQEEATQLRPQLVRLVEQTKVLQKQIEADISKRYKNRVVNLTGANYAI